jgi:hypothetical protein
MSIKINLSIRQTLDDAFNMALRGGGAPVGVLPMGISALLEQGTASTGSATTAPMTLWVDPVKGNNYSNNGLSIDSPFKTLQWAMDTIPQNVRHPCVINFRAGTSSETVFDQHSYDRQP